MNARLLTSGGARTWALVLSTGDEVVSAVERWADEEGVRAAAVTGIGAFSDVVLGFFDWEQKENRRIPVDDQVEVVSLIGDVALDGGEPKFHAHVVVGCADASARAGHLMSGSVRPTLELLLTEAPAHLRRAPDETTGLALIQLP